jgi:hypothetical protein
MGRVPPTFTLAITLLVEHFYPFLVKPLLGKIIHFRSDQFWVNILNCG